VKVMAGLDIAERRAPQDGRVRLQLKERQIDVRVSTLPGIHGESVVMRVLDGREEGLSLEELGMPPDTLAAFDRLIRKPHGIVLVSGPTGSGKTTTLYAALARIRTGQEKIVTVEDPVEYHMDGVTQVQVNPAAGVTFATALRSILRQDPDIILIGEMRDGETAEIAVHAALTGHLVFSTVHTNDAATGITRLLDLGVPDFLVASTVRGILAQRLVRRLCEGCREERTTSPALPGLDDAGETGARRGRGCDRCRGTGYHGRIGIFELLVPDEKIRAEILSHRGSESVRDLALARGMRTLREDGLAKVAAGVTSREEVERAAQEE
jgi:general secretion pathway protein E